MFILIIGGGNVGYYLAARLAGNRHTVSLVEKDKAICDKIAGALDVLVVNGDGCDPRILQEASIERANVIAAVTGDDEDNFIICQIAKESFNVKTTVARVNDPRNTHTSNELSVDLPVAGNAIPAKIIEEEVSLDDFVNLMTFKRGKLALVRVDLTDSSPVANKKIMDIKLPPDSVLVSIIRGEDVIVPKGETVLLAQDDVVALTLIENERQLLAALLGKVE